ncbi:inactive peptidyl-prolyl cis-trans isomerase shutdown-like [Manduca sexta]|uniref:inactive peptidyl-prolyl cis-trans isomerase shutdown n=1 Tax=Manduca sexta TaxID=7130 RepID=UPI001181EC74|nr:inactive peptidyl-prolyl cis-trans isomerase shutdown [Manduca sexta]XP_037301058.1 inactive peptidyl-prolyl cis-trans isomerase shutdown-like [Manduca sexta]
MDRSPSITLETGLDLRQVTSTGSILHISQNEDDFLCTEPEENKFIPIDFTFGEPVNNFELFEKSLTAVDNNGYVKKKVLEEGGGLPFYEGQTVTVMFAGYWENELEPFDSTAVNKPMHVDLNDNGLLPGLQIAIKSMLVGETSVFLLSYKVMYGEMGIPPRIKPKSDCVFYLKAVKCIITPKEGLLNISERNMFHRVHDEVRMLYSSGYTLYKISNYYGAVKLFNKAVNMLHKCRLADEKEEEKQEKLLKKLYLNIAICSNKIKKPLKTCIACNELNRLNNLWNNAKALLQNARALRMIGEFDEAEKKLKRSLKLCPDGEEVKKEFTVLQKNRDACNQNKLLAKQLVGAASNVPSEQFKKEVDNLITNFKESDDLCKLTLPGDLNSAEMEYIREVCIRENLFFNKIRENFALDKEEEETVSDVKASQDDLDKELALYCTNVSH